MEASHFSVCPRLWKSTPFLNLASAARHRSHDHSESRRNSSAWWAGEERRHYFRSPSFRASFGELAEDKPPVTQRHNHWINISHAILYFFPSLPKRRIKQAVPSEETCPYTRKTKFSPHFGGYFLRCHRLVDPQLLRQRYDEIHDQ